MVALLQLVCAAQFEFTTWIKNKTQLAKTMEQNL